MLQGKFRRLAPLMLAAWVAGPAAPSEAAKKLSKDDKRWLEEEVAAFITKEEVEIFKNLDSDQDRKVFKELFWARRDPNPMTPQNEFKEEFESRVTGADRSFKVRGRKGSATEPGQIFLLLGPPSQTSRGEQGGPESTGAGAPVAGGTPGSGQMEEDPQRGAIGFEEIEGGGTQTQTWTYPPNERLGIPQGLSVQFRAQPGFGYRLVSSKDLEQVLERVKARYISNPTINYSRDEKGRLLAPPPHADPNSPAKKILQAMMESKTATPDISFKTIPAFFRAAEGAVYIPLLFDVEAQPLFWENDAAEATLFGLVETQEGHPILQFEELAKLAKDGDGRALFEMPLQLQPGQYTLYLGVRDNKSSTVGTQMMPLEVPDYTKKDELVISSVLLYSQGKQVTDPPGTPGHAFQFGQVQFTPKRETSYKQSEVIALLYFVYGFGVDPATGQPNVSAQYIFSREGQRRGQTKDEALQANESQGVGNAEIPLGSFEPGKYKMQIKVTDHVTQKVLTRDIAFSVEAGSN